MGCSLCFTCLAWPPDMSTVVVPHGHHWKLEFLPGGLKKTSLYLQPSKCLRCLFRLQVLCELDINVTTTGVGPPILRFSSEYVRTVGQVFVPL